jgi:hemerythrin-like metal-binding protein
MDMASSPLDPRADESSERPAAVQLDWLPAYECGHPLLDRQHRAMYRSARVLCRAATGGTRSQVVECLDELIMHTMQHFRDEEAILEKLAYEDLPAHRQAHWTLVERTLTCRHGVIDGSVSLAALVDFVARELVANHMRGGDMRYFDALPKGAT